MGKTSKIPYIGEFAIYLIKLVAIYILMEIIRNQIGFFSQPVSLIFAIFIAFSFNPFYIIAILANTIIFSYILTNVNNFLVTLLIYMLLTLANTAVILITTNRIYKFKEVD